MDTNTEANTDEGVPRGADQSVADQELKVSPTSASKEENGKRERSTIEFPYTNLEDAEAAAKDIFREAGTTEVTLAQVAAALGVSAQSSGFRVKISALKLFGLVEGDVHRLVLTALGRRIAEAHTAEDARVEAFLRVPLYQKIVEQHDGHVLPPPSAFQRELIGHGVATKMAERARQVFDRSAKHANFIKPGSERFVTPVVQKAGGIDSGSALPVAASVEAKPDYPARDPVIQALVDKIPPAGSPWPIEEQVQLLQMLAMAFSMTYKSKRRINVVPEPEKDPPETE